MRGCLTFLATILVVAAAVAWFLPPPVADAVLSQSLSVVLGGPMNANVRTSFPPSLLTFRADGVDVTGSNARFANGTLRAATVTLHLSDVDLLARTAGAVDGTFRDVTIDTSSLGPLSVERIVLSGPSGSLDATATIDTTEGTRILAAAIAGATGRPAISVQLVPPSSAQARVGGIPITARLGVVNGDLVALPGRPGIPTIVVLKASALAPFVLTGVAAQDGTLILSGHLTGAALGF